MIKKQRLNLISEPVQVGDATSNGEPALCGVEIEKRNDEFWNGHFNVHK